MESVLQSAAEQLLGPLGAGGREEGGDGDEAVGGRELLEELLDEEWNEAEIASVRGRAALRRGAAVRAARHGAPAAALLRAMLLEIAEQEEALARSASRGMLTLTALASWRKWFIFYLSLSCAEVRCTFTV